MLALCWSPSLQSNPIRQFHSDNPIQKLSCPTGSRGEWESVRVVPCHPSSNNMRMVRKVKPIGYLTINPSTPSGSTYFTRLPSLIKYALNRASWLHRLLRLPVSFWGWPSFCSGMTFHLSFILSWVCFFLSLLSVLQLPWLATCFHSAPRSSVVGGLYPIRLCPSCPRRCSRPRCRASGPHRCSSLLRFITRLPRCVPIRCINSKLYWHKTAF